MKDENTVQGLDRTPEANLAALNDVKSILNLTELEHKLEDASALPFAVMADGRIVSVPIEEAWEVADESGDYDACEAIGDPTVAFVTPALPDRRGQGDRDAAFIVAACNAIPGLLARIRELEGERRPDFARGTVAE